ncbi:rhodanese-like domain-containing protein [Psychromarinibacter sp. C21-152]|uniref:Rhodanese-like domain-containing protein n=1 Tax=Psychromarinibacter sediminicola TaxID=3033385 RepID=A0AAE3T886_9RHOB|nr:rhodanese-like domain-containing protein [Psychromarinibacter sediminicola]MDF0601145.1 rhodanese-like domain-containing protein [Psychromarinibacter sediminicola]
MAGHDEDVVLIEVLSEEAFENFHLPEAINIPLSADDFDERVQQAAQKEDQVVVYCKDFECDASPRAAARLDELGYTDVLDYAAGKDDWRAAGFPVE